MAGARSTTRTGAAKRAPAKTTVAKPAAKKPVAKAKPKRTAKKDICFVICPFGGWHDEYHREIFCAAISAAGLEPARADDVFTSSNIVNDIWTLITKSRVLLADMTGKNPNVFYELGLAHAARKPVLLVTQSIDDVPFDLRALRVITYDVEHPRWGELLKASIEKGLQETLKAPEQSVLPTFLLEVSEAAPKVSTEEKRLLELQQQIEALRSEVRDRSRTVRPRREIGPD